MDMTHVHSLQLMDVISQLNQLHLRRAHLLGLHRRQIQRQRDKRRKDQADDDRDHQARDLLVTSHLHHRADSRCPARRPSRASSRASSRPRATRSPGLGFRLRRPAFGHRDSLGRVEGEWSEAWPVQQIEWFSVSRIGASCSCWSRKSVPPDRRGRCSDGTGSTRLASCCEPAVATRRWPVSSGPHWPCRED